MKQFLLR